ncbi:MAG: protein kinase [Planctomycetes bacterium]|nr:protein kinase [Planctomycetota bacterium]
MKQREGRGGGGRSCPYCGAAVDIAGDAGGERGECPACGRWLSVDRRAGETVTLGTGWTCSSTAESDPSRGLPGRPPAPSPGPPAPSEIPDSDADEGTPISLRAALATPTPGETARWGDYEILAELGRGGMGIVYQARQVALDRIVALKIVPGGPAAGRSRVARFQREAALVARLRHPGIVTVFEAGEHEGFHYFSMEYVEGQSLENLIAEKTLATDRALALLAEVARAVDHAHRQGVVHRDLKPGNILVDSEGKARVTDFGLGRLILDDGGSSTGLTRTEVLLGTPFYMAPEQILDSRRVDGRSDVFSLGVVLYEALTGLRPFFGRNRESLFKHILRDDPLPLRKLRPSLPRDVEAICLKALEKEPAHRYQTAKEMAEDLERARRGDVVLARPVPWPFRVARKAWRGRRSLVPLAILLLAAVVALLALAQPQGGNETAGRDETAPPQGPDLKQKLQNEREAQALLEEARQALEAADLSLYDAAADMGEIRRFAQAGKRKIDAAIAKAPDLPQAHYLLGRALILLGEDDAAKSAWVQAVELDGRFVPAHVELVRWYSFRATMLNWNRSQEPIPEALDSARAARHHLERALASGFDTLDDIEKARLDVLGAFVERDWDATSTRSRSATARFAGRKGVEEFYALAALTASTDEERLGFYDCAIEGCPRFFLGRYFRGVQWRGRADATASEGDLEGGLEAAARATADFDVAIALKPSYWEALNNGAVAWLVRGRIEAAARREQDAALSFDRAIELAGRAVERDPGYWASWILRARARRQRGDRAGASADYEKTLEMLDREQEPGRSIAREYEEYCRER